MSPFVPVGEQARWRTIYDLLRDTKVNDVLTYSKMAVALELHPNEDRHTLQVAMRRAAREFLEVDSHAVTPVVNKGYRVVEATEHYDLARRHQRRSSRELVRGRSKITHVDFAALDPATQKAFEVVAQAFSAQLDFCRRLDIRQRQLSSALANIQQDHDQAKQRTEEELQSMQERLARLEEMSAQQ